MNVIYWFSGTGNSRHAAATLAKQTSDATLSMVTALEDGATTFTPKGNEPLGIVTPVYFWGLPMLVHAFLKKLTIEGEQPFTYVVFTCGGSMCNAVLQVKKYLRVDYCAELVMPDNYVVMYDIRHPDDVKRTLMAAQKTLGVICNDVKKREKKKLKTPGLLEMIQTKWMYPIYRNGRKTDRFFADDRCDGCGVCAANCPDKAIDMVGGKPTWSKPQCELCLSCLHHCPRQALQYGKKTAKRSRYIYPRVIKRQES